MCVTQPNLDVSSFSCLTALRIISSTVLNRIEGRHPCFVPELREIAFNISPLSIMLVGFFLLGDS